MLNHAGTVKSSTMKYGMFIHYVPGLTIRPDGTKPSAEQAAAEFDVDGFATDLVNFGVEYIIFTAWHFNMVCLYPAAKVDVWLPGHSVTRDLTGEIIAALKARGIGVLLYTHPRDGHDFSEADAIITGWGAGGSPFAPNPNPVTYDHGKWNDFINDAYGELVDRYGRDIIGIYLDEGSAAGDSDRIVDYPRLRQTIKSRCPELVMIQNFYGNLYSCDIGDKEYCHWGEFAAADGTAWPAYAMPVGTVMSRLWWAEVPAGQNTVQFSAQDLFRYTVLQSGANIDGFGVQWAAGPYAGSGWESGVADTMTELSQLIDSVAPAVKNTHPSRSFVTLPGVTFRDLAWGVATAAPDGHTEYLHLLKVPHGQSLSLPAPADGKHFLSAWLLGSGHPVRLEQSASELKLTLDPTDRWDELDTVIALAVDFETLLIEPDRYYPVEASWITADSAARESWQIFRKEFDLAAGLTEAILLVTSCTYHEIYFNGRLIGRGPARSFDFDKYFDAIDVTRWVQPCRNVLAILSPRLKQKDVPYQLHPPDSGVFCELITRFIDGRETRMPTDDSWKTHCQSAFVHGTAWYAIPLGPEEQYDARMEVSGWKKAGFNDADWDWARVIGPVGTPPWTGMRLNRMPPQTNDLIYPTKFLAVEVAETPPGYNFRLGPASDGIMVFLTEVTTVEPATIRLHFTSHTPIVYLNGREIDSHSGIELACGISLLAFCQLCYGAVELELLIETSASLTFAATPLSGSEWSLYTVPAVTVAYPWHERAEDLLQSQPGIRQLLSATRISEIPPEILPLFQPARVLPTSSFHQVVSQTYSQPAGGFVASSIRPANRVAYVEDGWATSRVTARDATRQTGPELLQNRQNLLHGGSGFCLVRPQSGQDVHLVLDFGREYIGHIELALDAPADTVVDVQGFELIDDGGIAWMHVHNGFRYICRDGDQTFLSHYRRGFRYLSLTLRHFSRPVRIHQICCNQTTYPIEEKGDFSCSDELLNKIYRMSLDTAELCMLDSYVDCPGHEQNFWVGDARITALINLLNIGATDLNQSFIRIVGQSLREDWVKTYWPNDIRYLEGRYLPIAAFPNYPEGCLPMWTFQWLLQIWEHYWYVGDLADLAENFAFVEGTIQNCRRLTNERGLFDMPGAWNLIEWGNNDLSPYGEVTANNVLLIQCLRRAADMAEALARPELAREYRIEAGHRLAAVNLYCWDETRRAYVDTVRDEWSFCRYLRFAVTKKMPLLTYDQYISCRRISVQSNTLALLTGCVPAERLADVRRIAETVASGHYVSGAPSQRTIGTPGEQEAPGGIVAVGSPFFLFFSLGALYQNGQPDLALKIMRRDWADMIASGSNTCWETFKSDTGHWTRSIAHAWAAAPAFYLPAEILGIQPLEPGYRTFSINPNPGDLSWARGSVITPFGPIEVDWHKDSNGQIILKYAAPAACERKEH